MAKKLSGELKSQKESMRYYEDYKTNENFADILKSKITENFANCRKKMEVLYNVNSSENKNRNKKEIYQPFGKIGRRSRQIRHAKRFRFSKFPGFPEVVVVNRIEISRI